VGRCTADNLKDILQERAAQLKHRFVDTIAAGRPMEINFLALSGGGQNGAFGAGLLNGWTDAGTRPEFEVATGISTGALIAPYVASARKRAGP
jgi:predicted acylesterase/phospholipase RssA